MSRTTVSCEWGERTSQAARRSHAGSQRCHGTCYTTAWAETEIEDVAHPLEKASLNGVAGQSVGLPVLVVLVVRHIGVATVAPRKHLTPSKDNTLAEICQMQSPKDQVSSAHGAVGCRFREEEIKECAARTRPGG